MPRVPLPLKVFLSYVLVLAIGVLPFYWHVNRGLDQGAIEGQVKDLAKRARALSVRLGETPERDRVEYLESRRALFHDRVSLIDSTGLLLFDTQTVNAPSNHNDRPEIRRARGLAATGVLDIDDPLLLNAGVARRQSETSKDERLYVALAVATSAGTDAPVIRVSRSVRDLMALKREMTGVVRNTVALAISVAILLSLLSAFVIVRPLMRVRDAASSLAGGDWTVEVERPSDDEIGDIAKSIQKLGAELRKRMAVHGTAEGLVEQLVEVVPAAAAIFSHDGGVIAVNGPGRIALHIEGPTAGRGIRQLLKDARVTAAMLAAEDEGVPQEFSVTLDDGRKVIGAICALKRPGDRPYFGFVAPAIAEVAQGPGPRDVTPRPLQELFGVASELAADTLDASGVKLVQPSLPDVVVADARQQLQAAVGQVVSACAVSLAGASDSLSVQVAVEDTQVCLTFSAALSGINLVAIRPLVEPLGGAIDSTNNEVKLWLPRA